MARPWISRRRRLLLLVAVLAVCGQLSYMWWSTRTDVFTDNAYVVGNITPISSHVSGQVVALFVDDNMIVAPGDPIAQLNPVDFQIAVDQALADYHQAKNAAASADATAQYTKGDREAMLVAAEAKQAESEQTVRAAMVTVQTQTRLQEKDKELLASLQAQMPGLLALQRNAQYYYQRFQSLAKTGDVPGQEFDNREAAFREAVAKVESLNSQIKSADRQVMASEMLLREAEVHLEESRKSLANTSAMVKRAEAEQVQLVVTADNALALHNQQVLAEAKLRQAKLDLSNTLIRAPRAGIISRRTIQVGKSIEAGDPFLSITPLDFENVWIVANMRENQMPNVRVGQPVTITVDAIAGVTYQGWVESVAGTSGAAISLFPPDNATGNFVRVVQRIPVRVRFVDKENREFRVRPGMSTRITIDTTRYIRKGAREW